MSTITIYKASAGSGKTFTLTRHFLTLLFYQNNNYKHILAATFTNKATEEMKSRIISELHSLSIGNESAHRNYLRSQLPFIKSDEQLNAKAKKILADILHDYSHLSITTIDRFFQKIIRSFAREIRVSSNYNIELDGEEVLRKASEQLIYDLEKKGNEDLINWMTSFAEEEIEKGNSWNFSQSIGKLSQEFLKENYKRASSQNQKALGDFVVLKSFLNKITKHQNIILSRVKNIAEKGLNIVSHHNIEATDFKYGKGSGMNFMYKIAGGLYPEEVGIRTLLMLENQESWYTKTSPHKDNIIAACNAGLFDALRDVVSVWQENLPLYISIDLIRANFYSLGILSDLERQVKAYTDENNMLLLSNSNELIANIIDNSDTPFIYEKTGNYYKHFMLDEFQDTSQLQWTNLKPLIANSLAEGNENLIVGDVKQSIYRWRNSDWKQLDHGIKNEFGTATKEKVLPINWRSNADIIRFNNTLFQETAKHLKNAFLTETASDIEDKSAQLFDSSYADIIQQIPENAHQSGYVSLQFYDKKNNPDWKQEALDQIPKIIEQAQDKGYNLKDIAILVRNNKEGAEISHHLLSYASDHPDSTYRYDVISNDSLWISSSYDVQFIINIFKYLVHPCSLTASQLNILYNNYIQSDSSQDTFVWNDTILHCDIQQHLRHLTSLSLLESAEELINRFNLGNRPSEAIFIQSFIDIINNFEYLQSGGINEFLIWWNDNGHKQSISSPESQDAITIQTVHKSKGLEYKIVITPYLNWKITDEKGRHFLWTSTDEEPLNEIPYLPVAISKKLRNSLFKKDYQDEMLLQYIDTLNLLYVAFTRAKEAIIGFGDNSNNTISNAMMRVFNQANDNNENTIELTTHWEEENMTFEYGEFPTSTEKTEPQTASLQLNGYRSNENNHNLELRLQSHDFEIIDNNVSATASKTGKIWHRLFEQINALDGLPTAVEQLSQEGIIPTSEAQRLLDNVTEALKQPIVASWFSPQAKIRNEATILTPQGHNYRPDRLIELNNKLMVVDFKFGNIEKNTYNKQVQRYMNLIREMGHRNVEGYLWYVGLEKVVKV